MTGLRPAVAVRICETCGKIIERGRRRSSKEYAERRFCSVPCTRIGLNPRPSSATRATVDGNPVVFVPLTRGFTAVVDEIDDWVLSYRWSAYRNGRNVYAIRNVPIAPGKRRAQPMHTHILPGCPSVDHIDGNGLNNRRSNLRSTTHAQNIYNQRLRSTNTSGFKGVSRSKNRWRAQIQINGQKKCIGSYGSPEEAAYAYDAAALELFGVYARLNFPRTEEGA